MKIDDYTSGSHIRIDGKTYRQDLKIIEGTAKSNWWRKEGHRLTDSQKALAGAFHLTC